GVLRRLDVKEGDALKAGDPFCVVEAMKMENVLRADRDGAVGRVLAKVGDTLAADAPIAEFA
ncbi:MAG: acetyl-CoA carboxylase biotin carboxyl carrier protein subunit, partial [Hyphomicrobiales bacterium]|nr:acetyl-CoA carboxylase biotin carboxyl carrier protein subunit [Hyphomicrobiales bacterium]